MKIFILGGYGSVALPCAELLAENALVSKIALAGRHIKLAEQAAAQIGAKATAVQVDGADQEQVASCLSGYDLIINSVSNQIAPNTLQAAIHTGTHYCDVGWGKDFIDSMLEHTDAAREAGITAVVCTGISPCLTNLMGVYVSGQLDETEQLLGGRSWAFVFESGQTLTPQQWIEKPAHSLDILTKYKGFFEWMLQVARDTESRVVRTFQNDRWTDVDPLTSGVQVPLPLGGYTAAYPYGCYESLFDNLPNDLARLPPVDLWFSPLPPQLDGLFRQQVMQVAAGEIDPADALDNFYNTVEVDPDRWLTIEAERPTFSPEWVSAVGRKDGRAARFNCWLVPELWTERSSWLLTSVPLAVAALKILRGEVQEQGVLVAEKIFHPQPFFDEVGALTPEPPLDGKLVGESFGWLQEGD